MCNVPCELCGDYDECLISKIINHEKLKIEQSFENMDFVELEGQQHFNFEFEYTDKN